MRVRYDFSSRKTRKIDTHNKHRKEYPSLAKEVVLVSDVVIEVLDARFVDETRNKEMENFAMEKGKKIIYAINKADLVDIKQLRSSGGLMGLNPYVLLSCKELMGRKRLRDQIKIEAKRLKLPVEDEDPLLKAQHIEKHKFGIGKAKFLKITKDAHVGVIGYPNTGKSSIINMLAGRAIARVSTQAGFTKGIQKIRFAPGIILLDTPGVIIESENSTLHREDLKKHATIGVKTYDKTKNPDFVVSEIMKKYPGVLEKFYGIDANGDSEILLEELGRKLKFLRKGNLVDTDRTARAVLKDWQFGKIRAK